MACLYDDNRIHMMVNQEKTGMPLKKDGTETFLCCPVCGFDYVHPQGMTSEPYDGHDGYDHLAFLGECGHRFEIIFNFHKGNVFVSTKRLPDPQT